MKTMNAKQARQAECTHVWGEPRLILNPNGEVVKKITTCVRCGWQLKREDK